MDLATVQAAKAQDLSCGSFSEGSHQSGNPSLPPAPSTVQSPRRMLPGGFFTGRMGKPCSLPPCLERMGRETHASPEEQTLGLKMVKPFISEILILQLFPAHKSKAEACSCQLPVQLHWGKQNSAILCLQFSLLWTLRAEWGRKGRLTLFKQNWFLQPQEQDSRVSSASRMSTNISFTPEAAAVLAKRFFFISSPISAWLLQGEHRLQCQWLQLPCQRVSSQKAEEDTVQL